MRLTNRKTAEAVKSNMEGLKAKGMEYSSLDESYVKLAEYENAEEDAVCPFCGSTNTKINYKSKKAGTNGLDDIVYIVRYYVRCNQCFARGPVISGKVLSLENYPVNIPYPLPEWATTWQELKSEAVKLWHMRFNNVSIS